MKKSLYYFLFFWIILPVLCTAQVNVDKTTGAAEVVIPLSTVSAGHVSLPISVQYRATGIRPTDVESSAGVGWNISAGGAITRQVRGLPDDISTDNTSASRLGWLNNTNGTTITGMSIANTGTTPVQANVQTDVNTINTNFSNLSDTEPDIFNVSAPGLSVQFVFGSDGAHTIRTIPYQDVKITYTSTSAGITSFTVKNDQGTTYVFSALETSVKKTAGTTPSWYDTDFKQYQNGITYTSAWRLTQIKDLYNNNINISYTAGTQKYYSNKLQVYLNGTTNATDLYTVSGYNIPKLPASITYQEGNGTGSPVTAFTFGYTHTYYTQADCISSISGMGRLFYFTYTPVTSNVEYINGSAVQLTRNFLSEIKDDDCNTPVDYTFAYTTPEVLPDTSTLSIDIWGYYNGISNSSLRPNIYINPGNPAYERYHNMVDDTPPSSSIYPYMIAATGGRAALPSKTVAASLNKITTANGGYTSLVLESNDYYDPVENIVVSGSGLRTKQLISYDPVTATSITKNYAYVDGSGISTGKPISMPKFAFTRTYTSTEADSTKWRKSTVISWRDLSLEDHSIMYGTVKESQTGKGYTVYTNNIPATNWDTSAPAGYPTWSPTINYTGSPSTSAIGFLNNAGNSYPFLPNTNYDFERGTMASLKNYNDSGNEVSESVYSYQTGTPVTVTAFAYAANTSAEEAYGKYTIYTTATPLLTTVVNKQFDLGSTTLYKTSTESYYYTGTTHKKLTQQTSTNSDGSMVTSNIKYVKDYTITSGGDGMTQALLNLQAANVNLPVESYTQVTPFGGTAKIVSASLTKFAVFTPSGYSLTLPSQQSKYVSPTGTGVFTPSSINGGTTFLSPGPYTVVGNQLAYDYSGYLLSADNGFKHISTVLTDHNSFLPAATVDNARFDEIGFSDFDSKLANVNFLIEGASSLSTTSRSGQYGLNLPTGTNLSKAMTKNALAANYIVSVWVKAGTLGTLSAALYGGGGSVTQTVTMPVTSTPSGWQYFEFKLPLTGIGAANFEADIWSNQNIIIDDAWAYPDIAEVSSASYDPVNFSKTAVTNTNGVSSYFVNDKFGRQLYTLDQDKNILIRNSYISAANQANFVAPVISGPSSAYHGMYSSWSIPSSMPYNECIYDSGLSYTWDFGDGTAPFNNTASPYSPVSHKYLTNGTYTIRHTVSSSIYGSTSSTKTVTVSTLSAVNISYTNNTTSSTIGTVTFKQGATTVYTFTTAQLAAGVTITPGVYTIIIHPTGGLYSATTHQGYNSVTFAASDDIYQCFDYTGGDFTISSADLTYEPSASFSMSTVTCEAAP
jgi:hypothetical protein